MLMTIVKKDAKATCNKCGHPVHFTGFEWNHTNKVYKHAATPKAIDNKDIDQDALRHNESIHKGQ